MKQLLSTIIVTVSLSIASYAFGTTPVPTDTAKQATANLVQETTKASEFKGIIKKLDTGTALFTENEIYPLVGGDFETIVGKEVLIIGKLVTENDIKKISVARVQFEKQ
jgi:hypothetical protein